MSDHLIFSQDKHVASIKLNRPEKLNAITVDMLESLDTALTEISNQNDIRVVVLRSTSEKAFSVGADITQWGALQPLDMWREWITRGHGIFNRLASLRQPVIAVLDGYTFGGGLELALAADIRITSERATFAAPEVKLGTIPGWAGTQRLPQTIGVGRAKQMIFTGEQIDSQRAYEWGLVNEVVSAHDLPIRLQNLIDAICANAPVAVQISKQLIDANGGYGTGVIVEALASALTASTHDGREGLAAFQEKREAQFTGD